MNFFILYLSLFFIIGLAIGSFINVCVYRLPREESVVTPGSHCPACGASIQWFDNIPLLSYILLRGSCRACGNAISLRYPLLELGTAILFTLLAWQFPFQRVLILYLFLTVILIVVSGIDAACQLIPDIFSFSLIGAGLVFSVMNDPLGNTLLQRIAHAFAGGLVGGSILLIIGYLGEKAFGKEAMGGGDIKLLAGIGTILGVSKVIATLIIGSFFAAVIGLLLIAGKRISRQDYIPFGPFLALGAYCSIFIPDPWLLLNAVSIARQ